ncbi:protein BUNDLE SHEATH DEFECTIVE 2, chloroplastic-like [Amaranthus tricolor]|uniref:protein BUNDLE SHEATH DEFECTIVE 2, chloroplastic-like n=1 Tax=Amaranthus tricolor TaxID=29722 RepID=UPI002586C507|nr:protein BUNDLE SHEATH DEFECTIVE 2, chloroplastic-like [Amaranthus tricolor]
MANSLCLSSVTPVKSNPSKPGILIGNSAITKVGKLHEKLPNLSSARFQTLVTNATEKNSLYPTTKKNSLVCDKCDGNGIKECSQCEGSGVNSQDHFNGQFKAGGLCWLCRGKKEILCGNCNGAGFIGGFMNTFEE